MLTVFYDEASSSCLLIFASISNSYMSPSQTLLCIHTLIHQNKLGVNRVNYFEVTFAGLNVYAMGIFIKCELCTFDYIKCNSCINLYIM